MAAEQDELMLLERVFLRIGSAETDDQLEKEMKKFLTPVLLKLASQADGVRKKVMELLVHVNKRVKSRPKVLLPVEDLITQYMQPDVSPFVTNFTILYIKMGYPRQDLEVKKQMLPQLISCLKGRPEPQQNSLLQLILPVLTQAGLPSKADAKKELLRIDTHPETAQLLLHFMLDTLLLPYHYQSSGSTDTPKGPPPGLSVAAFKQVTGENPPQPEQLEKIKQGIIKILGADVYSDDEVVIPLLVASADTRHVVADLADRELKRLVGGQDWNKSSIISQLYRIFQGTINLKGQSTLVKPDHKRTPANIHMRLKLFPYLLKSREAAHQFPASVQVVFDCLYGENTNAKLKLMAVQFVHHLCFHCSDSSFPTLGAVLLSGMIKLIGEAEGDHKLKGLAYIAVGKIGKRAPKLVTKDIALLQSFFDAITKENPENKLAVQEALSMMAEAFQGLEASKAKLIEALIMQNIEKPEPQSRMMAVQYAKSVFPRDHIPSRYVLLVAAGDIKEDIYMEATRALKTIPKTTDKEAPRKEEEKLFPAFPDMVNYIQKKSGQRVKSAQKFVHGNNILAFNPPAYVEILTYLRMCLAWSGGVVPDIESTSAMQAQAPCIAPYVRQLLADNPAPIMAYTTIIRQLLQALGGSPAMYCLLESIAVAPDVLVPQVIKHIDWVKGFAMGSKEDMRELAGQLYALLVEHGESQAKHAQIITELTANLSTQSSDQSQRKKIKLEDSVAMESQHGSLLLLGYISGNILRRERAQKAGDIVADTDNTDLKASIEAIGKAIPHIVSLLDSSTMLLAVGACAALGEMGRAGTLPVDNQEEIVTKLLKKIKATKEHNKFRERAAICVGEMCVGDPEFPCRKLVIEGLQEAAGAQQFELHFTLGEALVMAAQGCWSPAARDVWTVTEEQYKPSSSATSCPDDIPTLLSGLLTKSVVSPNPHIKQAACIWLVAVVKQCGKHEAVQSKLTSVQSAFMTLLAENDELTQDIASKGLGIVYEKCGEEQKQELVAMLVDTLTTGKRPNQAVTGDTKVFAEGSLGKTPDGQNLSTYKELCSIANDLNQPDLIYKFMHLANHNAMWNSKKGAAFGFSTIAAQAGEQLAPFLSKIVPKMYRYQYDPNPKIQQAMTSIWGALVTNTKETVDKYMKEILTDLLVNLTSNQWRVRESSCLAVTDLLRGRALDSVVDQLPALWETCFRVRDDIKESVRNAADIACRALSRASIKVCDVLQGKVGEAAIKVLLPCLLHVGLGSQVKEVRAISLNTIVKICNNAGPLVKPHIPVLVIALLESLSELEPQYLNYVALHVAGSEVSQQKLDSARIAATKTSPMMDVINKCLQFVDADILPELLPRITELVKSAVGLGTKAGCAHVIITISSQCPHDLAPHAGKLLGAMLNGLNDRNVTIKKTYASAIGHVVKVAKDSTVEKLVNRLKEWYLEKEEESIRVACGQALQAMAQHAPDVLKRHGALALPIAFLAMHQQTEGEEGHDKVWEEVWLETTPGTEAGIRLYLPELLAVTQQALASQSWPMKAQGAAAMSTMASKLGSTLGPPHLGLVMSALLEGLPGRTWTGKEALLEAICAVSVSCKDSLSTEQENQPSMDTVLEALVKEARKESIPYKMAALKSLCEVLEKQERDRFAEVAEIILPTVEKRTEKMEDVNKDTWLEYEECMFLGLGKAWPKEKKTQDVHYESLFSALLGNISQSVWRVELAILKSLYSYLDRLQGLQDVEKFNEMEAVLVQQIQKLLPVICTSLGNVKYGSIRTEALKIAERLYESLEKLNKLCHLHGDVVTPLRNSLETMASSDSQHENQERATVLNKKLRAVEG